VFVIALFLSGLDGFASFYGPDGLQHSWYDLFLQLL
jgi:hypothetical protein